MHDALEPWEPEESVGKIWHRWASRLDAPEQHFPEATVPLDGEQSRLTVLFRGLGGPPSVELRPVSDETSHHRLSWRRKLGTISETTPLARYDGEILRLPKALSLFDDAALNGGLYTWLTACAAISGPAKRAADPVQPLVQDVAWLQAAQQMAISTLHMCPGLGPLYAQLCAGYLATRPQNSLPPAEAAVEALARFVLGDDITPPHPPETTPRDYRPMRPIPLWPILQVAERSAERTGAETPEAADGAPQEALEGTKRGRRQKSDAAQRRDSLILHKFEAILSFADFLNLNRRTEDDDLEAAKKAMDDLDELALTDVSKAPATRFKLHLDLSAEDVNREALAGQFTYPEWDVASGSYLKDHCVVYASDIEPAAAPVEQDVATQRRIRAVKRQFEAFRPRHVTLTGQPDGDDLDLNAVIHARADLAATGQARDRLWCQSRPEERNLAVSILLDTSRSTESAVTGRSVLDIEREALTALAWGLEACGDPCTIHAFSSLKRDRVYVETCKDFDTPMGLEVECRLAALRPGFYTRLGAAIRHVSAGLQEAAQPRRLLVVLTDGKPNDIDHYEGRHGIEDTRMAVREARRLGQSVFGITVDPKGQSWFPRLFGPRGYAVIAQPEQLMGALPAIYRQLVGGGT